MYYFHIEIICFLFLWITGYVFDHNGLKTNVNNVLILASYL